MKVFNPYNTLALHNCFGCAKKNPIGLALEFELIGDEVICEWLPTANYQGFEGMLHGGIISTIMDEVGAWTVQLILKTAGVTSELNVKYLKPVRISNGPIKVKAKPGEQIERLVNVNVELLDGNGKLCVEAHIQYFVFPEKIAKEKFRYPGIEAFFDPKN
ncbi:MAG: PaaI family thioesterase [Bacteroidetes bacterium]|jgi:uncharacterized protein (TIGR00369 family)|nr:PaaI family thioesterase [Bacteroidota bacterium]